MWEERFAASEGYLFGTDPATFLTEHSDYLRPDETALSVADGEGRNSVFMAKHGMQVTALELSPSAIARAQELAASKGVSVDFRQADLSDYAWETDAYDLVAGIFIQFVGPKDRIAQFEGIKQSTRPGGLVLLHGYTPEQIELGTGGPPFAENMYTEEQLQRDFEGWEILECRAYEREVQEGSAHVGQSALIDFVARKPH